MLGSKRGTKKLGVAAASCALVAAILTPAINAPARAATFDAQGSVNQVYATGLAPNAQASLITPKGQTLYTQKADSLGGILFRNVPAGEGYRVKLDPAGPL